MLTVLVVAASAPELLDLMVEEDLASSASVLTLSSREEILIV